ncbi:MAG TPA: N-acetyltransferase [Planctomycetota bacterium]|nr:N-acetyltransferase [Planctomycetota bacterium]
MASSAVIRPERPPDVAAVREIHRLAFPADAEARLVDALRAGGHALVSLVADRKGEVLGHVLFSRVILEPPGPVGAGLAPLAVHPSWQRRGIGGALVREGLSACAAVGVAFVVVLGDPAYYGRFGFRRASARGLGNEYGADAAFGVAELTPGALTGGPALVRYLPEFARAGA